MLKTSRGLALGTTLFLILLFAFTNHAQASTNDKSYIADKFDATAQIAADNTMQVTETEIFHFSGGSFSFVSREIPTDNTDGVTVLSAGMAALTPWFRELVTAGYIQNQNDAMSEFQRMYLFAYRAGENQTSNSNGGSGSSMSGSSGAAGGGSSSAG